jgi:hypothetical protein
MGKEVIRIGITAELFNQWAGGVYYLININRTIKENVSKEVIWQQWINLCSS